jgi:hypothetical protein
MSINRNNIGIINGALEIAALFDGEDPGEISYHENMKEILKLVLSKALQVGMSVDEIVNLLDEAKSKDILDV